MGTNLTSATAPQTRYKITSLLVIGLLFHVIFIGSVFDCYFTSPVVNGMKSFSLEKAEAKRLVLIVGDGLRADLLFNRSPFKDFINPSPEIVAPHLRSIVETRGAFGISHTRVPTESRPGHVAIIGGMYEDVSAVTKGWKTNPVDFDSIFNQSSKTFSFGSPDILPMFAHGATPGKVETWCYHEEDEDFTKDATVLDIWVLDQLRALFERAASDPKLDRHLRSDKVVFFLHLLGLDTTGHSYRPHSIEYMKNIEIVDGIVRDTEELMSAFYKDQETSYIFTADHGMSNIGNHGDGHPDNTRTPLVAWGKGIRGPLPDSLPSSHDAYSQPWGLSHLLRRDVEQADIAALMASLIGIDWPVNSVGVLPDVDPTRPGYLDPALGDETRARAALVNAKVILEHYRIKHELKESHTLWYRPFKQLEEYYHSGRPSRIAQLMKIQKLIDNKQWYSARELSAELIKNALAGLHYLQTYDRFLIRTIVSAAYLGWAAYASLYIFRPLDGRGITPNGSYVWVTASAILVLLCSWTLSFLQKAPWSFYVYVAFPCYFWHQFLLQAEPLIKKLKLLRSGNGPKTVSVPSLMFRVIAVWAALQGMVIGYTHRSVWSIGFLIIGVIWPLFWPPKIRSRYSLRISWTIVCLITSVFPLLSVDKKENLPIVMVGGATIIAVGWLFMWTNEDLKFNLNLERTLLCQSLLIVICMCTTFFAIKGLQAKEGLPPLIQISGWILLVIGTALPFIWPNMRAPPSTKLIVHFLGFGPCFVFLSIREEGIFYAVYSATLVLWIVVEKAVRSGKSIKSVKREMHEFQLDDLRIALFFLFFVQVGFFGTGNVASISSFYLAPVYRLIPIFNPFLMASLLIFKLVAPYVMLSVCFAMLNHSLHLPPFSLLLVALSLTDGMTLTFFFSVQDTGSWLEIGQSITFFCISSLLLLWSVGICALGEYLMANVFPASTKMESKNF